MSPKAAFHVLPEVSIPGQPIQLGEIVRGVLHSLYEVAEPRVVIPGRGKLVVEHGARCFVTHRSVAALR